MEGFSVSEDEWTRVDDEGLVQVPYSVSFPQDMAGPASPTSLGPFRRGSRSEHSNSMWGKENGSSGLFSGARTRKSSSKSKENVSRPVYAPNSAQEGYTSPTSSLFSFGSTDAYSHSRYQVSTNESRPSSSSASPIKKPRTNLFEAASGALNLRFGRKKAPIIRQPQPLPIILPGVIEISASRRDEEDEERNRLRETAAQSIGYTMSSSHHDTHSLEESVEDEDLEVQDSLEVVDNRDTTSSIHRRLPHHNSSTSVGVINNPHSSNVSIPTSPIPAHPGIRHRSGSILRHVKTNSLIPVLVPSFPCALSALNQLKQSEVTLHKFYPASSLRIFALSRNWKSRFMILTAPTSITKRNSAPPVSYLHLFKGAADNEFELERLEINEDSVVFVAEEDVGGRKHVVKVAGEDVGARRKELVHEEAGRTMWYLHIQDPNEAQMWITSIKSAILSQRTIRAGLGVPGNIADAIEPRGDMDVMLSMRVQGLISSPPTSPTTMRPSTAPGPVDPQSEQNYASSISSHRSQATVSKTLSAGIKGLFAGTAIRPRSASRATSIDFGDKDSVVDESFGSRGGHLMHGPDPTSPTQPSSRPMHVSQSAPEHKIDRKIMPDRINFWAAEPPTTKSMAKERANRTLSLQGDIALQPPPRKRWTSVGPTAQSATAAGTNGNGRLSPLGDVEPEAEASSPKVSVFHFTPEQNPREPSIMSVSTLASAEAPIGEERSSSVGTKRSSKRWSRQGVLPRRLTPPSGPPPATPLPSNPGSSASQLSAPSVADRRKSQSSTISTVSRQSVLPSFAKRASGSSFLSLPGPGAAQSPPTSRPASSHSHRISMPPPRPAPTGALPPAPANGKSETSPGAEIPPGANLRPNKRDSMNKSFRMSLLSQKPQAPPSSALPPRPDEVQRPKGHRRNSSADIYRRTNRTSLDIIPGSPIPSSLVLAPFPPPHGPLPPTPGTSVDMANTTQGRPATRQNSLKKRLRILSAPSSSQVSTGSRRRSLPPVPLAQTKQIAQAYSPPDTPIAEKIVPDQEDPSFLQIETPIIPSLVPPPLSRPLPEPEMLVTPLSPAPRRGSRQIASSELPSIQHQTKASSEGERLKQISRPGSVISLGIVSM